MEHKEVEDTDSPVDVEKEAALALADDDEAAQNRRVKEAAALLTLWSFFALVEGTIRMVLNSKPADPTDFTTTNDGTIVPVAALLAGGIAEVIFGLLGLYVGFFSLVFNKQMPAATKIFLFIQAPLGWFVFITFVLAVPIRRAINAPPPPVLSRSEFRSAVILGHLLGSVCFCWALQGGQFIWGLRLFQAQSGASDGKMQNAVRAYVWNGNMLAAAFSTIFIGCLLASKDFTSDAMPLGFPPHVVWDPALSIVTGFVMLAFGVVGILGVKNETLARHAAVLWIVTTTLMLGNFSFTFGKFPALGPPIPGAAQHLGLVMSVTILPMYFTFRCHDDP